MQQCGIARIALLLAVISNTLSAQPQAPLPRFRAGAALMQVDAYISQDGVPVTDLGLADLEVLEDDRPQEVANLQLIQPRNTNVSAPVPSVPAGALFVLFFDTLHVRSEIAERVHAQMAKLLNAVMGPYDRVGVMTPGVDDFWGTEAWLQWSSEMRKVLPEYPIVDVPPDHPIRRTMFSIPAIPQVTSINFWRRSGGDTSERGLDSPTANFRMIANSAGRIMVVMTHNTDIGDSWEREGEDREFFRLFSPDGYALGINVVLYALTH